LATQTYLGGTYPLHASATGKIILSGQDDDQVKAALPEKLEAFTANTITSRPALLKELRRVREQGYAVTDEELEVGLFAMACPVRDKAGTLIGVFVINGPVQRLKTERLPEFASVLREGAEEVAKVLA
jgi:DNA-binding IclR family transcriptional regulator